MADYGIRVINQATGSVQIDQNYANLEVYAVYNLTTTANVPPPGSGDYEGNQFLMSGYSHASFEIFLGRYNFQTPPPANLIPNRDLINLFGNYQHSLRVGRLWSVAEPGTNDRDYYFQVDIGVKAPVGTTVQVVLYAVPQPREVTDTYGLLVTDEAGDITFNSNRKYLRVVDVVTGADCRTFGTKSYPAGREYTCMVVGFSGRSTTSFDNWFPGGLIANYRYNEWAFQPRMNGNVLTGAYEKICDDVGSVINLQGQWPGNRNFEKYDFTIMVFDVTYYLD